MVATNDDILNQLKRIENILNFFVTPGLIKEKTIEEKSKIEQIQVL